MTTAHGWIDDAGSVSTVTSGAVPDPWQNDPRDVAAKSEEFAALIAAVREVQDLVAGTNPPEEVVVDVARRLRELAALLEPWAVGEDDAPAGKRHDLPGRGNPLLLPLVIDEQSEGLLRGRVRFTRLLPRGERRGPRRLRTAPLRRRVGPVEQLERRTAGAVRRTCM